ncbi:MAG TPA: S41 family peptidase [Bryobacteraceae bacterium]|nr:S41 family peptidase [Bryobacteraceae bacterium]
MNSRIKYVVVTTSTCLMLLLVLGNVLGKSASTDRPYPQLGVYTEVLHRIKSEYVEEPDMKSVTLGALNGLLESVDPFASYLNADQYKDYLKNKDVRKAGVGLVLAKKFGFVGIVGVTPGSPAAKAGLATNDMLETINGVATRDMPLAYARLLLEGDPGASVELTVVRVRRPEPQKIKLTLANIVYPAVIGRMLPDNIGYIVPATLAPGKVSETAEAIQSLQKQGAKKLILDLRNCAIGTPQDGIALANLFLAKGEITYLQGQKVPRQDFAAEASKDVSNLPLVVITNRGTADGAEIAAGALLDDKRATLVGERTYGDASLRKAITMDDGGAIILSVAKYYSPDGKAIQDVGVTPDTLMSEPEAQMDLDENGEPVAENPAQPEHKQQEDPLLKKAIEIAGQKTAA